MASQSIPQKENKKFWNSLVESQMIFCKHELDSKYLHLVRENVTGETQKGKREYFRCQGDIVWCGICRKYLFMPKNPDLNLVEVEYNEKSA